MEQVKTNPELEKIPTKMITTTDDPLEIEQCPALGCNNYTSKSLDYDNFITAIRQLGLFLSVIQVPKFNGASRA